MKKIFRCIANLFSNINLWFKPKKKEEPIKINEELKTRQQLLFDKLRELGLLKAPVSFYSDERVKDLRESARKRNYYADMRNKIKGFNKPSAELNGQLLSEMAKDRTTLKRQEIALKEIPSKKHEGKLDVGAGNSNLRAMIKDVMEQSDSLKDKRLTGMSMSRELPKDISEAKTRNGEKL